MMAKTVIVVDDLDGSASAETYTFAFDGQAYSIDLSKKNKAAFDKAMRPYLNAATRDAARGRGPATRSRRASSRRRNTTGPSLSEIRAWATENGIEVATRGRIAQDIVDAYEAAH